MIKDKNGNHLKTNDYVTVSHMPLEVLSNLSFEDQEKLKSFINIGLLISDIQMTEDNPFNLELEFSDKGSHTWFWIKSNDVEKVI